MLKLFRVLLFACFFLVGAVAECGGEWEVGVCSGKRFWGGVDNDLEDYKKFIEQNSSNIDKQVLDKVAAVVGGRAQNVCSFIMIDKTIVAIVHSIIEDEDGGYDDYYLAPCLFKHIFLYRSDQIDDIECEIIKESVSHEVYKIAGKWHSDCDIWDDLMD